ncbi:PAS domain-containing sensor histidine kinase [Moritella sp. 5]|uniref:sensor histidine kinase n=1 Tax=Moritella sp. 5 TaxID=2746231 RepID=UPI001BAAB929|nr:ATP-binding protein [Moritella sp. 5]QUM82961.1 PAS domain-containing sensor histidine kinase [Moritella sp. 5]
MYKYWRSNLVFFTFVILISALLSSVIIDLLFGATIAVLLILQLAVVIVALRCNAKFAYFAAIFEAVSFNLLFTTPRYSLQMFNMDDIVNLLVFVIVALTASQLAEHYQRQKNELKQTQLRNSILLSVSHDLRTPLATIIGTLTTLKEYMEKLSESEKIELLDSATAESHRLHQYIENLLQATKLQHGALRFNKSADSILNVVSQTIDRFPESRQRIKLIAAAPLSTLQISSSLIEQAIFNVLDNALRYTPSDNMVNINAYQVGNEVILDIQDEGDGITIDQAAHIFDLFYSENTHKNNDSGTGLGLAVAKGILTAHNGNVEAIPVTHGCLIRIRLPITKEEQ